MMKNRTQSLLLALTAIALAMVARGTFADRVRATHWFDLFSEGDGRRLLTWKGRFSNVTNIVNFYSTQEDVVCNGDGTRMPYGRPYSWYNQEYRKGSWAMMLHEYEGGWGINTYYAADPTCYLPIVGFYSAVSNLTREAVIEHPLFTPFRAESDAMHSTNLFTIADSDYRAMLRAKLLGDAIPATSFAAGANALSANAVIGNINYADCMSGVWPIGQGKWRHSDIKNVAYQFNWKIFKLIINNSKDVANEH